MSLWHCLWSSWRCLTCSFCQRLKGDWSGRVQPLGWRHRVMTWRCQGMVEIRTEQSTTEYISEADGCFTILFPSLLILRPIPLLWQKEQERLTGELTAPYTTNTVSALEEHIQWSSRKSNVVSWQDGRNNVMSVLWMGVMWLWGTWSTLCNRKDCARRGTALEVWFSLLVFHYLFIYKTDSKSIPCLRGCQRALWKGRLLQRLW